MAETPEDLQKQLNIFHDYCLAWKLKVKLTTGRGVSPGTLVSSTNKTDRYDIVEILLPVVLSIITLTTNLGFIL
jgi:hypothetical protein